MAVDRSSEGAQARPTVPDVYDNHDVRASAVSTDQHSTAVDDDSAVAERENLIEASPRASLDKEQSGARHDTDLESPDCAAPQKTEDEVLTKPVGWTELPQKDQLLILTLARLAEPLVSTSIFSYMYFMLGSFDPSLSDAEISSQTGYLIASFTGAQCLTAVLWGRLADKEWMGRKNVILLGLFGTFCSTIGFGFSKSFWTAMFFRSLGGALNGNVGVMRTMISEIVKEKKYQPKAFLVLPVTFNFGVLLGPLLGGYLQNPVNLYPNIFGPGSNLGGDTGVQWMIDYPYALPNLVNGTFYIFSILLVLFGLEETHMDRKYRPDRGLQVASWIGRLVTCQPRSAGTFEYATVEDSTASSMELRDSRRAQPLASYSPPLRRRPKLPYRRIFTKNVMATMLTHGLMTMHVASMNTLWFVLCSTPRFDPANPQPPDKQTNRLPFQFTGGLGLDPPTIGFAVGIIGFIGLSLQVGIYSRVVFRLGVVNTHRLALMFTFPIVYLCAPYLVMVPTKSEAPHQADGPLIWIAICCLLFVQTLGRTFALPISQILINNCTPHPSVLGAVHGIGQSVSSGCRTIGPIVWTALYGCGLKVGIVGIAFWAMSLEAMLAAATSWMLREGSGHEIILEGDEDERDASIRVTTRQL